MEEIAQQFKEELQELLNRYKDQLTTSQIMHIAQPVFKHTIGFKDNPERLERIFNNAVHNLADVNGLKVPAELLEEPDPESKKMLQGEFIAHPPVTNKWSSGEQAVNLDKAEEQTVNLDKATRDFLVGLRKSHIASIKGEHKCTD